MHNLIQSADYSLQMLLPIVTASQLATNWLIVLADASTNWCRKIMLLSFLKDGNIYRRMIKQVHTHKNTVIYCARASIRRKSSHKVTKLIAQSPCSGLGGCSCSLCSGVQFLFHKLGIFPLQKLFIQKIPCLCQKSSKSGNLRRINYYSRRQWWKIKIHKSEVLDSLIV